MSQIPYASILPYIEQIEAMLLKKISPREIAKTLNIPEKWRTIHRYKKEHFDLQTEAGEEWTEERQKSHEERKSEGKAEIIDNFELLNLRKQRARELLRVNIGDETTGKDGKTKVSFGYAAALWSQGDKISDNAIRQEQELLGDDPGSRNADALSDWTETRLAILGAVDDDPEAKEKLITALEERRRSSVRSESGDMGS
jgi:hypothetical protein